MNKITVIIPIAKSAKLEKILKNKDITKYIQVRAGKFNKYEITITELQTPKLIDRIKQVLEIQTGKSASKGYIEVHEIKVIAPQVSEKGKKIQLPEIIDVDTKKFVKIDKNFILFIISSTIIASIGFQMNNIIVLIAAILINPLMTSVMAVSYGIANKNNELIKKGIKIELIGILLIFIVAIIFALLPNPDLSMEQTFASTNLILISMLAIIIGGVAANSFITGNLESLVGVAVGISLLLPLINFAILLMHSNMLMVNSLTSFILNLICMHVSSIIFFNLLKRAKSQK